MQLSQVEIANFNRDGHLLIKHVLDKSEVEKLSAAVDRVVDEALQGRGENHGWMIENDFSSYFRTEGLIDRDHALELLAVHPNLLRCVGQCLGRPFMMMYDRMVVKHAYRGIPVGWHQDSPYQGEDAKTETFPVPNFTVGIYLDETTEHNGCLHVLPGRHLCGRVSWPDMTDEDLFIHRDARPIVAEPGDVSFHCLSLPHGSRANTSPHRRRLMLYHYVCREVYDDAYATWMKLYGGFSPENVRRLAKAAQARTDLNMFADYSDLEFSDAGIEYLGSTRQAPDAWLRLCNQLTADQLSGLRTVQR